MMNVEHATVAVERHAWAGEVLFYFSLHAEVFRNTRGESMLAVEQPYLVGNLKGMLQIVSGKEDDFLQGVCQTMEKHHHRHFGWVVEIGGGLIEVDDGCFLCDGFGYHHFLLLTITEGFHLTVFQFGDAHPLQAFLNGFLVFLIQFSPKTCIWTAPDSHHFAHCEILDVGVVGQHHAEQFRKLLWAVGIHTSIVNQNLAA